MESGTYAQIHYNPDDLDDVCVTKVEEPVSEEVPADAKTENMEESAVEKPEFQEESAEEDLQNVQSEEVQDRVASDQENDIFLEIEPESEKELEHTAEDEKIPVEGSEQPSDVKSGEVQSLQALAKLQDSLQRFAEANEDIQRTLRRLERKFTDEILNGENRDSSVKTIYKELNEYKAGIVEKALKNVLYDIVDIRETMLSQARFLREKKEQIPFLSMNLNLMQMTSETFLKNMTLPSIKVKSERKM